MSSLSHAQRRKLIAETTETITGIINRDEVFILVAITPAGPRVFSPAPEDVALRLLKLVTDDIDWDALPDTPADFLAALSQLQ